MNNIGIGKLITGEAQRDAIHVAIAPVLAGERLYPGQSIMISNGKAIASLYSVSIGIVDPFLSSTVYPEQKFWLFVRPEIVKNLRHHWTHPLINDMPVYGLSESSIESTLAEAKKTIIDEDYQDRKYQGEMTKENCHEWCDNYDEEGNPLYDKDGNFIG